MTDTRGSARFLTIYPGWYPGRTVHIHFKILTDPKYMQAYEFTSQLYFNDSMTDLVYAKQQAYARKESYVPRTRNEGDSIFRKGGDQLVLTPTEPKRGTPQRLMSDLKQLRQLPDETNVAAQA